MNDVERDIIREFRKEWRSKINVRQGKKEETVMIRFGSRKELLDLAQRLLKALGKGYCFIILTFARLSASGGKARK